MHGRSPGEAVESVLQRQNGGVLLRARRTPRVHRRGHRAHLRRLSREPCMRHDRGDTICRRSFELPPGQAVSSVALDKVRAGVAVNYGWPGCGEAGDVVCIKAENPGDDLGDACCWRVRTQKFRTTTCEEPQQKSSRGRMRSRCCRRQSKGSKRQRGNRGRTPSRQRTPSRRISP